MEKLLSTLSIVELEELKNKVLTGNPSGLIRKLSKKYPEIPKSEFDEYILSVAGTGEASNIVPSASVSTPTPTTPTKYSIQGFNKLSTSEQIAFLRNSHLEIYINNLITTLNLTQNHNPDAVDLELRKEATGILADAQKLVSNVMSLNEVMEIGTMINKLQQYGYVVKQEEQE
jgi:hypothetical protein